MFGLQISAKDVKAGKLVKAGWYATKITDQREEPSKDKESRNLYIEVEGMEGDSNGVPCLAVFSEKFPQSAVPFVNATGQAQGIAKPTDEEKGVDPAYSWPANKNLVVYAQWGTYRGKDGSEKPRNNIIDWAPLPQNHPANSLNPSGLGKVAVAAGGFE